MLATAELPRDRPYNSFVILPDGTLVTKDFAGSLPGAPVAPDERGAVRAGGPGARRPDGAGPSRTCPSRPSPACRRTATTSTSSATPACCGSAGTAVRARPRIPCRLPDRGGADVRLGLRAGPRCGVVPRQRRRLHQLRRVLPRQGDLDDPAAADPGGPGGRLGVDRRRVRGRGWAHHQSAHRGRAAPHRRRLRQRQRGHGRLRHRRRRRPHPSLAARPRPRVPPAAAARRAAPW